MSRSPLRLSSASYTLSQYRFGMGIYPPAAMLFRKMSG